MKKITKEKLLKKGDPLGKCFNKNLHIAYYATSCAALPWGHC